MVNYLIDNTFFKPTVLYKEFMILDLIEKNSHITQREISKSVGVAVSMVNSYLDAFENSGLIRRKKYSTKNVEYFVTKKGLERKKLLNINYLHSSQELYNSAKENIEAFLMQLNERGYKKIFLYGAGEVAEILLQSIYSNHHKYIEVLGVIDDNVDKLGNELVYSKILPFKDAALIKHDGILISSYSNKEAIFKKLRKWNYSLENVLTFFEI